MRESHIATFLGLLNNDILCDKVSDDNVHHGPEDTVVGAVTLRETHAHHRRFELGEEMDAGDAAYPPSEAPPAVDFFPPAPQMFG